MKNFKLLITLLVLSIWFTGCKNNQKPMVLEEDVAPYLSTAKFKASTGLENVEKDIAFAKEKLEAEPNSITNNIALAGVYSSRFGITKNIEDLQKADSLYLKAYNSLGGQTVGNIQTLAQHSITTHHFKDAEKYGYQALEIGDKKGTTYLLLYDAMMERGKYDLAEINLNKIENTSNFGYLTRRSKYNDYEGNLDSAIVNMERAAERIDFNTNLSAWSKSNLGDMYGHANRVEDSYQAYLDVLEKENTGGSYLHTLKGIAWIAYAHDNNTELAKKILQFVDDQIGSPEVKLTLAEIAEFEGNTQKKEEYLNAYVEEARKPAYFGMYDAYLIDIAAAEMDQTEWAMELVKKELDNRPSPQIYDLQAWTYLHQNKPEEALQVIQEHVDGKTYEPVPAYHMARIYDANGMQEKAQKYYKEALAAGYELGPITEREIRKNMN